MIHLDGTNGNVNCGNDSSLDFVAQNFTISMRIKPTSPIGARVLFCRSLFKVDGYYCGVVQSPTNSLYIYVNTSGTFKQSRTVANVISIDQEYHLIFQKDGTVGKIFVDGVECSYSNSETLMNPATSSRNAYIGQYDTGGFRALGIMNEIAIWDAVLSLPEISLLSNSKIKRMPLQIRPSNLQFYLPLDEVPDGITIHGKTFKDLSQNSNDGTGSDAGGESVGRAEEVLSYP